MMINNYCINQYPFGTIPLFYAMEFRDECYLKKGKNNGHIGKTNSHHQAHTFSLPRKICFAAALLGSSLLLLIESVIRVVLALLIFPFKNENPLLDFYSSAVTCAKLSIECLTTYQITNFSDDHFHENADLPLKTYYIGYRKIIHGDRFVV